MSKHEQWGRESEVRHLGFSGGKGGVFLLDTLKSRLIGEKGGRYRPNRLYKCGTRGLSVMRLKGKGLQALGHERDLKRTSA